MEAPLHRFSSPVWVRLLCVFGAIAFPVAAYFIYAEQGWSWLSLAILSITTFAIAGAIDALTSKVEVFPERLVVVANLRRREHIRSEFVSVSWAKGVPVVLQSKSGENLRLPAVGSSAQGLTNTLRAWIKKPAANAT